MNKFEEIRHPASFRDPAGFMFWKHGVLYRQINRGYADTFQRLEESGIYGELIEKGWLIQHERVLEPMNGDPDAAIWIRPELLPFISYPYEWSFDMLRDAALLTLSIAEYALEKEWMLKDASPYNVQWRQGRPILIDSLSFEPYREIPWVAYRQFCSSFLSPLLLMHYQKRHLPELFLAWPDGVPIELAAGLLPRKSRWSVHTFLHIHLQARYARKNEAGNERSLSMPKSKLQRILLSLRTLIASLKSPDLATTWSDYYEEAAQRGPYLEDKKKLIETWLSEMPKLRTAADLGANEGVFSQLLADKADMVVAADIDPECINRLYQLEKKKPHSKINLIVQDIAQPSPGIGVANKERTTFHERLQVELILALALVHHLAIERKIPLATLAAWLAPMTQDLIIEWVPSDDEKAAQLLNRIDGEKPAYSQQLFESTFSKHFSIHRQSALAGSNRLLYWLKRKT